LILPTSVSPSCVGVAKFAGAGQERRKIGDALKGWVASKTTVLAIPPYKESAI